MKKMVNIFGISALFLAAIYLIYFGLSFFQSLFYSIALSDYGFVFKVISYVVLVAQLLFFVGLIILGREFKRKILLYSAAILLILLVVSVILSYTGLKTSTGFEIGFLVLSVLGSLLLGVGIFTLGSKFGLFAKVTGVLYFIYSLLDLFNYAMNISFMGSLPVSLQIVFGYTIGISRGILTVLVYLLIGILFFRTPKVVHGAEKRGTSLKVSRGKRAKTRAK